MGEPDDFEAKMEAALKPFGWTCGPEFWKRYFTDAWVFNLANAVEAQAERIRRIEHHEILDDHEVCDEQLREARNEIARLRGVAGI